MKLSNKAFGLATAALAIALTSCGRTVSTSTPDEEVTAAWHHFQLEEFDQAQYAFQEALTQLDHPPTAPPTAPAAPPTARGASALPPAGAVDPPADALRINALYGLGMVASLGHHGEQADQAQHYFEQVIALDDPQAPRKEGQPLPGEMAAWAALAIVRDHYLPARSDGAVDIPPLKIAYADVIARYPGTPAAEEAFMYRAGLFVQTLDPGDARQAIDGINAYLAGHPATSPQRGRLRTALYSLLTEAHTTLHEYPEALAAAIASVESKEIDTTNPRQNNILEYYRIGMMAQFDVGDFATARKYYQKFLAEYPRDQRAFNVQLLLKHLDDTETRLRAGLAPKELSTIATGEGGGGAKGGDGAPGSGGER